MNSFEIIGTNPLYGISAKYEPTSKEKTLIETFGSMYLTCGSNRSTINMEDIKKDTDLEVIGSLQSYIVVKETRYKSDPKYQEDPRPVTIHRVEDNKILPVEKDKNDLERYSFINFNQKDHLSIIFMKQCDSSEFKYMISCTNGQRTLTIITCIIRSIFTFSVSSLSDRYSFDVQTRVLMTICLKDDKYMVNFYRVDTPNYNTYDIRDRHFYTKRVMNILTSGYKEISLVSCSLVQYGSILLNYYPSIIDSRNLIISGSRGKQLLQVRLRASPRSLLNLCLIKVKTMWMNSNITMRLDSLPSDLRDIIFDINKSVVL